MSELAETASKPVTLLPLPVARVFGFSSSVFIVEFQTFSAQHLTGDPLLASALAQNALPLCAELFTCRNRKLTDRAKT